LITYAAGLDANTIIWIAETFREEHRAAIDFLNHATSEDFAFFGVQIELYKIGDSSLAPDFIVVSKPNDWNKRTLTAKQAASAGENENEKNWFEYWSALKTYAIGKYPALERRNPYRGNWQTIESLRTTDPSVVLNATIPWEKSLRVEIYIDRPHAKAAFHYLQDRKSEIEATFGSPLVWEELPNAQASRICFYMPGDEKRDNREAWPKQQQWLVEWGPKLANAVRPHLAPMAKAVLNGGDGAGSPLTDPN
jgi:hypothetical protein